MNKKNRYNEDWVEAKCDKYDYLIAVFCGAASGMIDVFFVGTPGKSKLCDFTDSMADSLVKKFAKLNGWEPRVDKVDNIQSAIGFLEKKFSVNYDQRNTTDVGGVFNMGTKNHHFKSLSHSPDIVGLFFSILDQFTGKSSFLNDGKIIRVDTSTQDLTLYGQNPLAKLFCAFCNWIGHIMSDLAGSSGGRGAGTGRGTGVSIPFMELFQLCNFGELSVGKNKQTLATIMTRVFQEGYDLRYGGAMAIPVIINELMIRVFWVVKAHFYKKKDWKDCVPTQKNADLRMMLLFGYGTFCLLDGTDAVICSGGNAVTFILRLNFIGWVRFVLLVFKELRIRYGDYVLVALKEFIKNIDQTLITSSERKIIIEFNHMLEVEDENIMIIFNAFVKQVDQEYLEFHHELDLTYNDDYSLEEQSQHSILLARICGVEEEKIIKARNDLDDYFLN